MNVNKTNEKTKISIFNTLNTVTCAMLCAVAVILASSMHAFMDMSMVSLFSPMHFPVLLMGILCGPVYGVIGGAATQIVSFIMGGAVMPITKLIPMAVELAMYGLMTGLLRKVFLKNPTTTKFFSTLVLIIAMVVGRAIHSVVKTLIASAGSGVFIETLWANFLADFTGTWVGIILQLILIPALLYALLRGGILIKYIPDIVRAPIGNQQENVQEVDG